MSVADDIRASRDEWKKLRSSNSNSHVDFYPIREWNGQTLIVMGHIDLRQGMQRLTVIDITDSIGADVDHALRVARFAKSWPEQGRFQTFDGETKEEIDRRVRCWALVLEPDEGHTSVMTESKFSPWKWARYADLAVRVESGTREDMRTIRALQMDELEQSVDAGGSIS